MAKIYTKTGDEGMTGLLSDRRIAKDHSRIEAYGTVDELNAVLGVARSSGLDEALDSLTARIQEDLFMVGSALADPNPDGPFHSVVRAEHVEKLEAAIDDLESTLPRLTVFILPGGTTGAAHLHLARTVCRRAERALVALSHQPSENVPSVVIVYLNRLSDLLFVMARSANHRSSVADIPWKGL
ncbi:MAG: ATP:cob(I)alamin adenosyltransferase [Planctomycetes bacterium SCN 63-9]|nr:MAG: ATP:cob(I)alamin adenosyltransferase [Planctomycetes bacterium SCN 63-9]